MNKSIYLLSGCDGAGKSTIINTLKDSFESSGRTVKIEWLRYIHWSSRIVNGIGRLLGRSYYTEEKGHKFGYHNYHGLLGIVYVLTVFVDFKLHRSVVLRRLLRSNSIIIIDRYTPDIVADLILDTGREGLVKYLFFSDLLKDINSMNSFIVTCSEDIILMRRRELENDLTLSRKLDIYNMLASDYQIPIVDTSWSSVIQCCSQILDYEKSENTSR